MHSKKHRSPVALVIFMLISFATANAQETYTLHWGKESALMGGSIVGCGLGYYLINNITPLTPAEALAMKRDDVNYYERQVTYNYSEKLSTLSDIILIGVGSAPLFMLTQKEIRNDWFTLGVLYSETALLTTAVGTITKGLVKRNRPFVYNPDTPLEKKTEKYARQSFFSSHTAFTFATATLFSVVYDKYYPKSTMRPYVTGAVYGAAAVTAYLRYQSGHHFQSDIIVGAMVGTAIGYLIPAMHEAGKQQEEIPFSLTPGTNYISLSVAL